MSKLLQRLSDAAKSGVYRAAHERDILEVLRGSNLGLARIDLSGAAGKDALMERIAHSLALPGWFGKNWDALDESLADLAWSGAAGYVMLFEGAQALPADARSSLKEVLAGAAQTWKSRNRPFFAVFIEAASDLPELYRERQ